MMDIAGWHAHLAQHFALLREARRAAGVGRPVFALEHGLGASEVEAVITSVRAHIIGDMPPSAHELAWVVYATEIGYAYAGDEYWQTFEQQTPSWAVHGDRKWIRRCFRMFHKKYGGAEPSGAWAERFSIICWPITHAILPLDLQRQLARILYELRHSFSAEILESPPRLGELIAARSWSATSRFQNLAQETHLLGQIASALLLQGQSDTDPLIHPATLKRIGDDLDRERLAREWMRGARRFAQERTRIRGLAPDRSKTSTAGPSTANARAELEALGIEPRLMLRPKDADRSCWELLLEIPDLSHLLLKFPKTRDILTGSRCVVAGSSGRPLARSRCLHGAQRIALSRWPREDEILLQFEETDPQLEYLLRAECLLRPGASRLFRIASDGLAYEARSFRVRPGERYILVNTTGSVAHGDHARPISVECDGVHAVMLSLPAALTSDWEDALRHLGLGHAKTIEVWPAGLGAVVWDGEGYGEWLASERPCLAIRTDHPAGALAISMGDTPDLSLELTPVVPGEAMFVELPQLAIGTHTVRVCARGRKAGQEDALGKLDVVIRVRESRPWAPGLSPRGLLSAQLDPASPTLEQLWEGRVEVALRGPAGRQVECIVSLHDTDAGATTVRKHLPPLVLPIAPDNWRYHFEKYCREARELSQAYDEARACELEFTCEDLGAFTVRCEREFTPLRWSVRRDEHRHVARLRDDSGESSPPQVMRLAFEKPCVEEPLAAASEYTIPAAGGLYLARQGTSTAAIITPPTVRGISDLGCVPSIDGRERSAEAVLHAVMMARTWSQARLSGDMFSATRQRDVFHALAQHISRLICGSGWAAAEHSVSNGTSDISVLKRAISTRREEAAVGALLAFECAALADATSEDRVRRIASLATSFCLLPSPEAPTIDEQDPEWLSELALRLASAPASVEEWAGADLRSGVAYILEAPTLARAARFLVIATDHHLRSRAVAGEIYAGWGWS